MNISEQVVSLGLAMKLKSLGLKQENYFHYSENGGRKASLVRTSYGKIRSPEWYYSAFSVAELCQILPPSIFAEYLTFELTIKKFENDDFYSGYVCNEEYYMQSKFSKKLSDSLALLLIEVIEDQHGHTLKEWRKQWLEG